MAADDVTVGQQIEEIKILADRSLAYDSLHQLQRRSADDPSSMEALSLHSPPLIPILLPDIHHQDEEIAALALKCLGFMLYHPALVPAFSDEVARSTLDSLAKLIMGTRMKAICNLGVWCISMQQLSATVVESCISTLVGAVAHALDNPFGSLSTTFEAIQAVMKLAIHYCDQMRRISDIWVPPIYKRLISNDKKERDMASRCLLKTKSTICPPDLALSKATARDLKKKLLPIMVDNFQDRHQKVHIMQAWGWYICLLGSVSLKNRCLLNEMLKISEKALTDPDPQVQIASLVSWEHLINALLPPQDLELETKRAKGGGILQAGHAPPMPFLGKWDDQINGLLRRIKVIMMPLQCIISSSCDISVRSSCLNTWCYLLHKLDLFVNHPSVLTVSFWPILEMIFLMELNNQSHYLWISCFHLLNDYVLAKGKSGEMDLTDGSSVDGEGLYYSIKWMPWKISDLDFHLKLVGDLLSQGLVMAVSPENRILAFSWALRIFRSVLQGVQAELKIPLVHYDTIQFCITTIYRFMKSMCEDMVSKCNATQSNDLIWTALQFVEAIGEEVDPSVLASPLYQLSLDLKYIENMQPCENVECMNLEHLGIDSLHYMNVVSPMAYSTILHLSMVAQSILNLSYTDDIPRVMQQLKSLIFSVNPLLHLHAAISFLYMHVGKPVNERICCLLIMWRIIAEVLKQHIECSNGLRTMETEYDGASYNLVVYWVLCYPVIVLLSHANVSAGKSIGNHSDMCLVSSKRELELEPVIEVWESLFHSFSCGLWFGSYSMNNNVDSLCQLLVRVLGGNNAMLVKDKIESSLERSQRNNFLLVFGELIICMLQHIQVSDAVLAQGDDGDAQCSTIKNCLWLISRFLEVSLKVVKENPQEEFMVVSRVFAAVTCLVDRLYLTRDILLLMEVMLNPLVQWLSWYAPISEGMQQVRSTIGHLQCLWTGILDCLQRSQPQIEFDSGFLRVQSSLLQTALDHPHLPISDTTIAFWNATYSRHANLHYPQCLLPVLDKLSRSRRIKLCEGWPGAPSTFAFSARNITGNICKPDSIDDMGCVDMVTMDLRRKRLEMAKKNANNTEVVKSTHGHGPPEEHRYRKADDIIAMLRRTWKDQT